VSLPVRTPKSWRCRSPIMRCCERPWVISATTRRSACSGPAGKAALLCGCGRRGAGARCDIRVAGDVYGRVFALAVGGRLRADARVHAGTSKAANTLT
jgi:hypothetical protein